MSRNHNHGPSCLLRTESELAIGRASETSPDPPRIRAQFFYSSALPIDDPLSPVPPPTGGSGKASSKVPPRPFSIIDNIALETAWQLIHKSKSASQGPEGSRPLRIPDHRKCAGQSSELDSAIEDAMKSNASVQRSEPAETEVKSSPEPQEPKEQPGTESSLSKQKLSPFLVARSVLNEKLHSPGDPHLALCDDPDHIPFDHTMPVGSEEIGDDEFESGIRRRPHSSFRRKNSTEKPIVKDETTPPKGSPQQKSNSYEAPYGSSPSERLTTGTPFLRAPARFRRSRFGSVQPSGQELETSRTDGAGSSSEEEVSSTSPHARTLRSSFGQPGHDNSIRPRIRSGEMRVTVGASRLHVVEMPDLKMGPIYWDPVHDISSVVRGTWFYKESMMPVDSDVANQIEEGYEYFKPWTQTYADELNSCLEIGADAELKIVYKLWPADKSGDQVKSETGRSKTLLLDKAIDQLDLDEQNRRHAIIEAANPGNRAAGVLDDQPVKLHAKSSIIYANARDAQILQPSLLPSVARGRRPLAAIRKGRSVGIPVVRGFDYKAWERLYPPLRKRTTTSNNREAPAVPKLAGQNSERPKACPACEEAGEKQTVTDLVLVIHGIGQKLSERVESFHFTHAINAFRRQINVELEAEAVKPWLRQDFGGVMINWRSTLKLEDGGPEPDPNRIDENSSKNQFNLKDITAESIPAVRNLISDVMLDIPYYLSHHKKKMIEAVIKEANRVYRLWCNNNEGFEKTGRVHLIAHSLGSVMALDILSKQPTKLPEQLDLQNSWPRDDIFEFDTKALFLCGSPAGFFLLLHRAPLLPRRGREKPGADGQDIATDVAGEAGTYGCPAIDNLYNVMHYNDPIAYRVNACVDVDYAAALRPASVPNTTHTWMQSIGSVFRTRPIVPPPHDSGNLDDFPSRPSAMKMPSTLEMETHDFTREEIAEKRMFLLNDNGQIDYTLHSGGGPLEIQYLNMLSAHSSYWTLQDFVRFIVVEIGRKSGKSETLAAMKAVKKIRRKG